MPLKVQKRQICAKFYTFIVSLIRNTLYKLVFYIQTRAWIDIYFVSLFFATTNQPIAYLYIIALNEFPRLELLVSYDIIKMVVFALT